MIRNYKLVLAALMAICMVQGCSKKQEGCKLDSECPNGQICRNMKCEAAPAGEAQPAGEAAPAAENKADGAQDGNAAANPAEKPTVPVEINLGYLQENKIAKLEDLGLDIDYILDESLDLHGTQKLEIGPGVTIDMHSSSSAIRIYDDAALMVKGTEAAPVIFKSTNSSAWSGIHFSSKNKDNTLNYLQIQNADGEDGVVDLGYESRVGIDHLTLDGSAGHGIHIGGDSRFTKFTNNTIKNCKDFPIILDSYASISDIGEGNVFENNNRQFIKITAYTFDDVKNTVIKKQPIPYYLSDGVNVDGDSGTLTIEAGTEFVFEHEKSMRIGESIQLKLEGTAEAPVIMRGLNDEAHFWQGFIYDSTRPGTISGLVMSNTGYDEIPSMRIRSDANVTIQNITFKATDHRCMEIGGDAKVINKGGLSFEKCGKGNIFDERIEGEDEQRILKDLPVAAE